MAFPLIFMDEDGTVRTYRWKSYPEVFVMVDPKEPPPKALWVRDTLEPVRPTETKFLQVTIYCGPAAPSPTPPTADEFARAVYEWLFH